MKASNWIVSATVMAMIGVMAFVIPRASAGEALEVAAPGAGSSVAQSRSVNGEPILIRATKESVSFPSGGSSSPATFEAVYFDNMTVEVKVMPAAGGSGNAPTFTVLSSAKAASDDYKQTNVSISVPEGTGAGWVAEVVFIFKESGVPMKIYAAKIVTS